MTLRVMIVTIIGRYMHVTNVRLTMYASFGILGPCQILL